MTKVTIGIQARSTSKRFPTKVNEVIGRKTCLQHVVDNCQAAILYLNNFNSKDVEVNLALLIPYGDPIKQTIKRDLKIIEGPEDDVLSRYVLMINELSPDYIVRVTGDCPEIPPYVISKIVMTAVKNEYDYVSNVDERCRTAIDGYDCEVISKRAMVYLHLHATKPEHREHVTVLLRTASPGWLSQGIVVNFLDLSRLKLSLDTLTDLERIRLEHDRIERKLDRAVKIFGKRNVHRF